MSAAHGTGALPPLVSPRRTRALRGPKHAVDPWAKPACALDLERLPDGRRVPTLAVFLIGAECPFTCAFCDLWKHTLDGPTPRGALPHQLELAMRAHRPAADTHVKLYNASNFFDPRAVPPEDDEALAGRLAGFERVVVECHPRWLGERCRRFGERLGGRLQVAMGVETVRPEALRRLGKGADAEALAEAARRLLRWGFGWRAFVLVGAPLVPPEEDLEWIAASVRFALEHGAEHVSLIPVRAGEKALDELSPSGAFAPPPLERLETALERALDLLAGLGAPAVVGADLWDLERFSRCDACLPARRARLERMHLEGRREPAHACPACGPPRDA